MNRVGVKLASGYLRSEEDVRGVVLVRVVVLLVLELQKLVELVAGHKRRARVGDRAQVGVPEQRGLDQRVVGLLKQQFIA